jgi:hypothetical protein
MEEKTRIGYMCQTDFEHELGKAVRGNLVYPSVAALKIPLAKLAGITNISAKL